MERSQTSSSTLNTILFENIISINIVNQIENAERIIKRSTCITTPSFSLNDDL